MSAPINISSFEVAIFRYNKPVEIDNLSVSGHGEQPVDRTDAYKLLGYERFDNGKTSSGFKATLFMHAKGGCLVNFDTAAKVNPVLCPSMADLQIFLNLIGYQRVPDRAGADIVNE
jgi:hypothetical protein